MLPTELQPSSPNSQQRQVSHKATLAKPKQKGLLLSVRQFDSNRDFFPLKAGVSNYLKSISFISFTSPPTSRTPLYSPFHHSTPFPKRSRKSLSLFYPQSPFSSTHPYLSHQNSLPPSPKNLQWLQHPPHQQIWSSFSGTDLQCRFGAEHDLRKIWWAFDDGNPLPEVRFMITLSMSFFLHGRKLSIISALKLIDFLLNCDLLWRTYCMWPNLFYEFIIINSI